MDYAQVLKERAAETVTPLLDAAKALEKEVVSLRRQLETERGNVIQTQRAIEKLKASAGEKATDRGAFERLKTDLKKRQGELATGQDLVAALAEALPPQEAELAHAQRKVFQAFGNLAIRSKREVEAAMGGFIGQAAAERTAFLAALEKVYLAFGGEPANFFVIYNTAVPDGAFVSAVPGQPGTYKRTGLISYLVSGSAPPPPPAVIAPASPDIAAAVRQEAVESRNAPIDDPEAVEAEPPTTAPEAPEKVYPRKTLLG